MSFTVTSPFVATGLVVANQAARTALSFAQAAGRIIRQTSDGKSYILIPAGTPSNLAHWVEVGAAAEAGTTSDSFSTVDVDGVDITAGGPEVALNLISGSGILLTPNAGTKTVTVSLAPPYVTPTFSQFSISGYTHNQALEYGTTFASPLSYSWTTTTTENITPGSINIGLTVPSVASIGANVGNSGTNVSLASPAAVTAGITTSGKTFQIIGNHTSGTFQRTFVINGFYPWMFGAATGTRPTANEALVLSASGARKLVASSSGTITATFSPAVSDSYLWFAIPVSSTAKTKWADPTNPLNNGLIGGESNLFADPVTVSVTNGSLWTQDYRVYVSNYPVALPVSSIQFLNS